MAFKSAKIKKKQINATNKILRERGKWKALLKSSVKIKIYADNKYIIESYTCKPQT